MKEDLTGKARLFINVLTGWFSYAVFFVAGFFLPRLIDNQLGQFSLGVWDFAWSFVNYFAFASLNIGSSLNRYVAKYRAENNLELLEQAVSTTVYLQLIIAMFVFVVTLVVVMMVPTFYGDRFPNELGMVQQVIFFLGLSLVFQFVFDTSRGVLTGCHRWDLFNGLNAFSYMATVFSMIAALLLDYGLVTLSIIYAAFALIQGVVRSLIAVKICPEAKFRYNSFSKGFVKEVLPFGLKAAVIGFSPLIIIQTSYLLVAWKLGPMALAILARPMALVKHIETFITRFTYILAPMAGSLQALGNKEELKNMVVNCARYGFAFTLPPMVILAFYGDDVIRLWMGDDYVANNLVLVLVIGFVLPISQSPVVSILIGMNAHGKAAYHSVVLTLLVYLVLFFSIFSTEFSIQKFALLIAGTTALVNGVAIPFNACRDLGISYWDYIRRVFFVAGGIGGLGGLLLFGLENLLGHAMLKMVINCMIYGVYTVVMYWCFLFSEDAKVKLISKFKKKS